MTYSFYGRLRVRNIYMNTVSTHFEANSMVDTVDILGADAMIAAFDAYEKDQFSAIKMLLKENKDDNNGHPSKISKVRLDHQRKEWIVLKNDMVHS